MPRQPRHRAITSPSGTHPQFLLKSLSSHRVLSSTPFQLSFLRGCQLVLSELDLDLLQCAGELERHLRVVVVDDRRAGVHADIEALIECELSERIRLLDMTFADFLSIDDERSLASLAETAAVIDEIKCDGV